MEFDSPAQHKYFTRSKTNKSKRKTYQNESSDDDDDNESIYDSNQYDGNKLDSNDFEKNSEPKDFQELLLQLIYPLGQIQFQIFLLRLISRLFLCRVY